MKKTIIICTLFFAVLHFSTQAQSRLEKQLIGQWRNLTMHLNIIDAKDTTKKSVFACNETNWESMLHIRPIRTFFNADHSFHSEYYSLKDSLVRRPTGRWELKGDQLTFYYLTPDVDTSKFTLSIRNDVATFKGMVDWSGDGKKDDEYVGTQRKFK